MSFLFYSSWLSFWVPEQHENELIVEKEMKHLEQRVTGRSCVVLITLPFFFQHVLIKAQPLSL